MYSDILADLVITNVYLASTMYNPQSSKLKRTNRPQWAVIIKYEGETVYTCNGKQFISNRNHPILLPKGCSYDWECTKSGHYSIIEFECEKTLCEPVSFSIAQSEKLLRLFKELEYKRNLRKPMFEMESIRDTYSLLLTLMQAGSEKYIPSDRRLKLQPALEYISQNYNKHIKNDTLAAISGMSTVYFRKQFTEIMGVSPIAYARALRIEKAAEMLKSDYGTLSDIAQTLGYASLYDFSRDFKKHIGVAPSKY